MAPNKQAHINWNWQLSSTPEQLWTLVTDTNRLFKNLGFPVIQPTDCPQPSLKGSFSDNSNEHTYSRVEEPLEWEYPYRFGVKRTYKTGPFSEVKIQLDLFPNEKGTRLQYQLWCTSRYSLSSAFTIFKHQTFDRKRIKKAFRHYDELIKRNQLPYEAERSKKLVRGAADKLKEIRAALIKTTGHKDLTDRLLDLIQHAEEPDLLHIKPYKLADHWNADRTKVLHLFLHAVKEGLLRFNWDLFCPACRTIQQTCRTLGKIHEPLTCSDCSRDFTVNFSRSIQLSFYPDPLIRETTDTRYCPEGPQNKSHVAVQQYIKPGRRRYLKVRLPKGVYHLQASGSKGRATIVVSGQGSNTVNIRLSSKGLDGEYANICPEPNLMFENATGESQLFTLQKASWSDIGVTAAQVTSLQSFRDLFPNEVLGKGEKIAADSLTLMFTDLLNSAALYHQEGDNTAVDCVLEHFDILQRAVARENGALVKTIGDSIMAVFSTPEQALRAFGTAQKELAQDSRYGKTLRLKAGIHHGACVAVNLNNRIDYFGSTVNIASRLADLANANEVVIFEDVYSDKWHRQAGNARVPCSQEHESAHLKGFNEKIFHIRRIRFDHSPLRLAI